MLGSVGGRAAGAPSPRKWGVWGPPESAKYQSLKLHQVGCYEIRDTKKYDEFIIASPQNQGRTPHMTTRPGGFIYWPFPFH